jgi:hypothetical protein
MLGNFIASCEKVTNSKEKRIMEIIVGFSGASGVQNGIRLLKCWQKRDKTHLY